MEKVKRSGTEKREKSFVIGVRVSAAEKDEIEKKAALLEISAPAFLRNAGLDKPKTKSRKVISHDRILLSKIFGELGKIGSNLNQIARRLNQNKGVGLERLFAALDELIILKEELLKELKNDNQRQEPQ